MGIFSVLILILYYSSYLSISVLLAVVICTVSSWFNNFGFPSHASPAYSHFGTTTFVGILLLTLVSRCEYVRIASILHTCALSSSIAFALCASHEQSFELSTPRYVCWSAIGNSLSPHVHLKAVGGGWRLTYFVSPT